MTKNNPLFVDSTKFHGDRIATLVELTDVILYDEETVIALVIDHQGEMSRVPLELAMDGRTYEAKVWLSHQKQITVQFLIEKNDQEIYHSSAFKARAQYAVVQKWEPMTEDEPLPFEVRTAQPITDAAPKKPELKPNDSPRASEWALRAEQLIEKWDL